MKLKLSVLLFSMAAFCQEPKTCESMGGQMIGDTCNFPLNARDFELVAFRELLSENITDEQRKLLNYAISQLEAGNDLSPAFKSKLNLSFA